MKKYLIIAGIVASVAFLGYFGYLQWRVEDLKADKVELEAKVGQLEADLTARDEQIVILQKRESKMKQLEKQYAKDVQELSKLPSGPVSPVLRYAIGVQ